MNPNINILSLCILLSSATYAQEANFSGARNESMAEATVALQTNWALFTNPSGMQYQEKAFMIGYQSKYVSLGIHDGAFGFTFPIRSTALGLGVAYFGDELLNNAKVISGIAHKIGKTSLGAKATYEQWSIRELGSKGILYVDIGGQMEISDKVIIGMELTNLNQAKFDTMRISNPVTTVKAGLNYHPHEKLVVLAQVEKDIRNPALLRLGIEYLISPHIAVRSGVLPTPTSGYSGIGLIWPILHLDLAGSYQQEIGWSGSFSIDVPLAKRNEN